MNIPNVGPQLPTVNAPHFHSQAPVMTQTQAAQQLGCIGCGAELPQLSDVAKPGIPTWMKIVGIMIFFGGVFGLLAYTTSKKYDYPDEPDES